MITCEFEDGGTGYLRHSVIDAIIIKGDAILLVKRSLNTVEGGKWALPGGFIKRDENALDATLRELKEETGYQSTSARLFCIITNPDRTPLEDRQNIVFCYEVHVNEGIMNHDDEVTSVNWVPLSEAVHMDLAFDHLKIVNKYLSMKDKPQQFPLVLEKSTDY